MRKWSLIVTIITIVIGFGFLHETTYASPVNSLKNKQKQVKDEREQVKKNLSKAEAQLADILVELKDLNEEIVAVEEALNHNKKIIEETEESIEKSEKESAELEEEIADIEEKIRFRNDLLKKRLTSLHKSGGASQYLEVVFGAKSFMEFISRITAVSQIANNDVLLLEKQEEDKKLVVEKHNQVEQKLNEQKALKEELEGMQTLIVQQQKENDKKKKTLQKKEKELQTLKAELQVKDSSLAALEAQIRRDIANARTVRTVSTPSQPKDNLVQLRAKVDQKGLVGAILNASRPYYGVPYRWAGRTPSGFDCSGFVHWAFRQVGYNIPASTSGLSRTGKAIPASQMQPGDLVFFDTYKKNGHVGIYLGNGKFLGSQNSTGLAEASMNSSYWKPRFKGHVRRVH